MERHVDARIFLADQRGYVPASNGAYSHHTVNAAGYVAEGRTPVGQLALFGETVLPPQTSLTLTAEQAARVVLVPVTGSLEATTEATGSLPGGAFFDPGQAGTLLLLAGDSYTVSNPYETETIVFLQCWLTNVDPITSAGCEISFDLSQKNRLLSAASGTDYQMHIGLFDGRSEGTYLVSKAAFVFVLSGVFEVANRLLHAKDGLALRYEEATEIDFEALSNDAILLVIGMDTD